MLEGVVVLLAVSLIALAILALKQRSTTASLHRSREEQAALEQQLTALQQQQHALAKYQAIVDAEAHAAGLVAAAERTAATLLAKARFDADAMIAEAAKLRASAEVAATALGDRAGIDAGMVRAAANSAAKELRETLANDARALQVRAETLLANATAEANGIVEAARRRAQEIAGDAYTALEKAKDLEQTARAMKNVIEGYGDQYIVPTAGLLDELAEELGFAEAGVKLKAARLLTRTMIKNGSAAACDYVEANRKLTAIDFVLDAFNGKVDSALADVRHDNFGTLDQKIKDAFSLVNHLGQAFRNARITPEYLQARREELRWAVVAQELKQQDREEQRLIKERIREEEKAQREYERAMKEAEKEEELLRKTMEKVQREFDKAGDEQKAKFEAQLAELNEKLRVAEEKNQRALSMAQQTKAGHVYVISNVGSFGEHVYKIGLTRRLEPMDRIKELGDASVPFDFDVHSMIRAEDAPALERNLHKRFLKTQVNKVNPRKEFFRAALQEIREEVERMGCAATWTMTAECRDFKETQAIERQMQSHTFGEAEWEKRQLAEHDAVAAEPAEREAVG